jgi:hypothetical protein
VERVVIALVLMAVAAVVAGLLGRRRTDPPTQDRVAVPRLVDRGDFVRPEAPWLLAVFTSETCDSCARATAKARVFESPQVAYEEIPWQARRDLHDRYRVEDVPLIVVADAEGVVQRSFVGTPTFTDLAVAVAEVRQPGSTSSPDVGRLHDRGGVEPTS